MRLKKIPMSVSKKTIREHCIAKGLVVGTYDYKREYSAEKLRRRSPESKKLHNRKSHERRQLRLKNDLEFKKREQERWRKVKQKQRLEKGDLINERQRKRYKERGNEIKRIIYDGRNRRNPHRGLASLIKAVRSGRIESRELVARTSAAIEQCRSLIYRKSRKSIS